MDFTLSEAEDGSDDDNEDNEVNISAHVDNIFSVQFDGEEENI